MLRVNYNHIVHKNLINIDKTGVWYNLSCIHKQVNYTGKLEMAEHFMAADAIEHEQSMMTDPKKSTLENFKVMMQAMWKAFPDMKFTAVDTLVEGNRIMVIYHMTGTNTGEFMGMKATNKKIDITGVDIVRIANGKFVEHWGFMDSMVMMQQLGMMH